MQFQGLVTKEDVIQEAELRSIVTGKKASKFIIKAMLSREAFYQPNIYDLVHNADQEEVDPLESLSAIVLQPEVGWGEAQEELIEWALDQSTDVQECICQFLEDPESNIDSTIQKLAELEVISSIPAIQTKPLNKMQPASYADILRDRLPATIDELIRELSYYPIKRPAATVRQFLRRNAKQIEDRQGLICIKGTNESRSTGKVKV